MTLNIELYGNSSITLKLPMALAKMCGTLLRMTDMTGGHDFESNMHFPVPFDLDQIGDKLYQYLEMQQDNPEFVTYTPIGRHGERKKLLFDPWENHDAKQRDVSWGTAIKEPMILHRLYSLADFLEVPSLMDLCSYVLNAHLFATMYNTDSPESKAKQMRTILEGCVGNKHVDKRNVSSRD